MEYREERETLICQCDSEEHQFSFVWVDDEYYHGEVFMKIHLSQDTLWERIKSAIKYVFGHRSVYGDFDEVLLKKEDACKLERIVEYLKK